jgi:flagellar hook-associated protein 1 FlgK
MSLLHSIVIGQSGLRVAQAGINATSQNVANASTEGATLRRVVSTVAVPRRDGVVWVGQGVTTSGIERPSDRMLLARRVEGAGETRRAEIAWDHLKSVERILDASEGTTTKDTLDQFFDALTRATADPSDLSLRRGVVRAAQDLSSFVARDARVFSDHLTDQAADAAATLPLVNDRLQRVAQLNDAIASSQNGTLSAGDLVDQRDQILRELGEFVGARVEVDARGVATVFLGDHAAVSGGNARTVSIEDSATGPRVFLSHTANERVDVTDGLGGEVGGRLDTWREVSGWLASMNTFAADLADAVNAQHRLGFDLNSTAGGDLFLYDPADPARTMSVSSAIVDDAALLAFGETAPTTAGDLGNLRLLLDLEDVPMVDGRRTAAQWLTDLVSEVGTDVATVGQVAVTQDALLRDLDELHQNLHGIDLDEQAANLMMYQTAYQASARVVTAANGLVDSLLEMVR